jgi:predicted CoA-binding protein
MRVAILGASDRPDRYAYMAFRMLKDYGHEVALVNPKLKEIEGVPVVPALADTKGEIDTLTMYVGPQKSNQLINEIIALKPRRVIFNPGSENDDLIRELGLAGIHVVEGCTLVLLRTNQFLAA